MMFWTIRCAVCVGICLTVGGCRSPSDATSAPPSKASAAITAPKIEISQNPIRVGTVKRHQHVAPIISLTNAGTADLVFERVQGSCGIHATLPASRTLTPGQTATIPVTLDTSFGEGPFQRPITIATNDPNDREITVTVEGNLQPDVRIEPWHFHMGEVVRQQHAKREFTITVLDPETVTVTSIETGDPEIFSVTRKETADNGVSHWSLRFAGSDTPGDVRSRIRIRLTGSATAVIEEDVIATVVGDLRYPERLFFPRIGGEYRAQQLTIASRTGTPIRVTGVEDPADLLDVDIHQDRTSGAWNLSARVRVHDVDHDPDTTRELTVHTTCPDTPAAKITYSLLSNPTQQFKRPPPLPRPPASP